MATQLKLMADEQVAFEIEADVLQAGTNPIAQMIARVGSFIGKILGNKVRAKLVVTTKRVMLVTQATTCYCIPAAASYKVIMPTSVKEVGYLMESACFGVCKGYIFYFEALTERSAFVIKDGSDDLLSDYVAKFYTALNA